MPSPETSADQLLDGMKAAIASNAETQRLLQQILRERVQSPNPSTASTAVIHAGGITNAMAICIALTSVMVGSLFAIWIMWQLAEQKSQQEAWIQVWQQRIATEVRK